MALTAEDLERCMPALFYGDDEWFQRCMRDGYAAVDFRIARSSDRRRAGSPAHQVGFAARASDPLDLERVRRAW
ncbi:MAG: hypothetical protein R3E96_05780 [Planctomycetota bacterium]